MSMNIFSYVSFTFFREIVTLTNQRSALCEVIGIDQSEAGYDDDGGHTETGGDGGHGA